MNALVTAIIPAHNYARFLPRAIDSVLAQTYQPIECLVVDDGSTDNTSDVLARYQGRIRTIHQANSGPTVARNAGIAVARGELIAFLDSDDWWAPEKIALQVACLASNTSLAAVGCGVEMVDRDLKVLGTHATPQPFGDRVERLRAVATRRLWMGGSLSGILARKSVLEALGGFDTTLRAAEDWDLWLRLFAAYEVTNLPEILAHIHSHGTGSFRNAALVEEAQWQVVELALQRWPDELRGVTYRKMRALVLADAANEYIAAGDLVSARRKMAAALRAWPFDLRRLRVMTSLRIRSAIAFVQDRSSSAVDRR